MQLSLRQPPPSGAQAGTGLAAGAAVTGVGAGVGADAPLGRIIAFDGLRGVLAMMVLISHFFGEVEHAIPGLAMAWIAVRAFFVLSGFLMARIILENLSAPNFALTFYMRRACRTLPVYLVLLVLVFGAVHLFHDTPAIGEEQLLPLWSFLTFTQGFVMVSGGVFGSEWLTPTWTLTVEEQFYLIAPLVCLLAPRRWLIHVLLALAAASVLFRVVAYGSELVPVSAALVLLPGAMHAMFFGMIAALVLDNKRLNWALWDPAMRVAPLILLGLVIGLKLWDGETHRSFEMLGVPLVSVACACYLVALARGAPEAARMTAPTLRFLGRLSYSIYLLHVPVLGLMHGLVLGARPDIATPAQLLVTCAAVPVALAVAWVVNRTVEQPIIAFGRRWRFARPTPRGGGDRARMRGEEKRGVA